ncbi:MAG: hypothetical protein HOE05_23485, partial [Rhodospirillaceae bacterium]|nr:hypothetical protein [Rhodospirillaceae bacterium]
LQVARFYPARSWENPAATVDQFVTAVLRLLMCGPSPGAADVENDVWQGGPNRPVDEQPSIGPFAGQINFSTNRSRNEKFMTLATECFQGSRKYAAALTALVNLDWGHNANSKIIPDDYLRLGCGFVFDVLRDCRPRVILTMANTPGRTWDHLRNHLSCYSTGLIQTKLENMVVKFPEVSFCTLLLKSPITPSYAVQKNRLDDVGNAIKLFLAHN